MRPCDRRGREVEVQDWLPLKGIWLRRFSVGIVRLNMVLTPLAWRLAHILP
jgi:hypothetical protein